MFWSKLPRLMPWPSLVRLQSVMLLENAGRGGTCAVMCRLQAIAGSPELYPELIRLGGLPHILALLSHDNSDIAASAIQLLRELTDADAIEDSVRPSCLGLTSIRAATSRSSHLADALSQHPCKIVG